MIPVYDPSERPEWMDYPATIRELAAAQQYEQMQRQTPLIQAILQRLYQGQGQPQAQQGYGNRVGAGAYMPQSFMQSYQTGPGMMDYAWRKTANHPDYRNPTRERDADWAEIDRLWDEEIAAKTRSLRGREPRAQASQSNAPAPRVPTMGEQSWRKTRQTFGNLW